MAKPRFHLVSLGCAKNTVDSESMTSTLTRAGYQSSDRVEDAEILIVNTCGFIKPARDESLDTLRRLASEKRSGQLLIAAGCLSQRDGVGIARQVPGIDGLLGTRRWMDIVQFVKYLRDRVPPEPYFHLPDTHTVTGDIGGVSRTAIQGASAYLKIADGCRRPCAFCAIPSIKGPIVSRSMESILEDARYLRDQDVREINLIAQDTTDYGHDLGLQDGLATLLDELTLTIPEVDWIRILYAYPGYVTDRLIDVMTSREQIVPYLDIPLQHAHPAVLKRMRRPSNMGRITRTIEKLRAAMPDLTLRTTFIVGYPGETEGEFRTLLDFVTETRFDRLGVFAFSFESGTASEPLGDPIATELKEERRQRLMTLQQGISLEKNKAYIGRTIPVLIEGIGEGISMGRSYRDAPEIDGMVIIDSAGSVGQVVPVHITGALPYDLLGVFDLST